MSVESFIIAAVVEEGTPKRAFQAGIADGDFEIFDEEWKWIIQRAETHKPITTRLFKNQFPDFDFIRSDEKLSDLIEEFKGERTLLSVSTAIDEIFSGDEPINTENAVEKAMFLREVLGDVLRTHAPHTDIQIKGGWETHYERIRQLSILAESGEIPGIPTGLAHLDLHWGGLQGQSSYLVLGRPGDAKSFFLAKLAVEAAWSGYRIGFFSPEMTDHQHFARFHTLLSAKKEIQQALGLKGAFRNRALKDGRGFNIKSYRRFLEYLESHMAGEIHLFTQKYRSQKMNVGYIRSRVEDFGLDAMIVDPIYKLRPPRRRGTRWEELQELVDSLTDLAHEFNIPLVMSNQANRALVGKRGDAPDKDSSFGSDAPVQEADTVIGVKHYSKDRIMKLVCSKNRHGESFGFTCRFMPNIGVFEDVTKINSDYLNGYDPEKVEELSRQIEKDHAKELEMDEA